jgi:uncharacterized membrane protein
MSNFTTKLAKAISWKIFALITTMIIVFNITGNINFTFSIAAIDAVIKIVMFIAHDYIWDLITLRRHNLSQF